MIFFTYKYDEYYEKLQELKELEKRLKVYKFLDNYVINGAHAFAFIAIIISSANIGLAFSQDKYSDAIHPAFNLLLAVSATIINVNTLQNHKKKIANIKTKIEDIKTDLAFIKSNKMNNPVIDITPQQKQR